jgi:hypothetical protein
MPEKYELMKNLLKRLKRLRQEKARQAAQIQGQIKSTETELMKLAEEESQPSLLGDTP